MSKAERLVLPTRSCRAGPFTQKADERPQGTMEKHTRKNWKKALKVPRTESDRNRRARLAAEAEAVRQKEALARSVRRIWSELNDKLGIWWQEDEEYMGMEVALACRMLERAAISIGASGNDADELADALHSLDEDSLRLARFYARDMARDLADYLREAADPSVEFSEVEWGEMCERRLAVKVLNRADELMGGGGFCDLEEIDELGQDAAIVRGVVGTFGSFPLLMALNATPDLSGWWVPEIELAGCWGPEIEVGPLA